MVWKRCHVKSLCLKPSLLYLIFSSQANASHFWLNEGWTTYIERVLLQILHSPEERGLSFVIGSKALNDSLKQYEAKPKYQRLAISFEKGEDPDDAYSSIPYEKGANFILHLGEQLNLYFILGFEHNTFSFSFSLTERILGGLNIFLPYVKDYVETFIGKSITTEQWKEHLYTYFSKCGGPEKIKALDGVDWDVSRSNSI
jgi:leukotriene-A4 hydrolase